MITAWAPGRVNLIGEHTDYNAGFVLPTPIPQRAHVELTPRGDDRVIVRSREFGRGEYRLGHERHTGTWLDYVQGYTAAARQAGHALAGCELAIHSEVPIGGGLASSAALEVAVLRALREAFALALDDVALALLGQRAEHDLVGVPVGAMDQLAASLGRLGAALLLDMRSLAAREVPLPRADLIVISSGVQHAHASGEYRTRRAECEEAARWLGVPALRDLGPADAARIAGLPDPLDRRARHVVTENARVLAAADALAAGELVPLGVLLRASHASLRDDFEVSIPVIDALVAIACSHGDVFGARLTGGGFGGSIVAIALAGTGARAAEDIRRRYEARTGNAARILLAGEVPCNPS